MGYPKDVRAPVALTGAEIADLESRVAEEDGWDYDYLAESVPHLLATVEALHAALGDALHGTDPGGWMGRAVRWKQCATLHKSLETPP